MRIQFKPNFKKSLEAVVYVVNKVKDIDVYHLVKVIFHADLTSINTYGAPITGDTYLAMPYGTVPSMIYNDMVQQKSFLLLDILGLETLPIRREGRIMRASRPYDADHLSETDMECLNQGIAEYAYLSFEEAKEKNHTLQAWKKAYSKRPNEPIDWYDLIEDPQIREELEGLSHNVVV